MRERDIEKHLVQRVKEMGGEVRKVKWIGRRGAPDRLVMLPARYSSFWKNPAEMTINIRPGDVHFAMETVVIANAATIWIELKAPGVKPEPHQVREHNRMRTMGQRVEVIDSIEGVEALLA